VNAHKSKALLLDVSVMVAAELQRPGMDRAIRTCRPRKVHSTHTDGWFARVGTLGRSKFGLQVWLDRFTKARQRRFWFGLHADDKVRLPRLAKRLSRELRPHRLITSGDVALVPYVALNQELASAEFGRPVLEKYDWDESYYGIYVGSPTSHRSTVDHVVRHATGLFEAVARAVGGRTGSEDSHETYSAVENRTHVASHVARERNGLLPAQCKLRDKYVCQVCRMRYRDVYGQLGTGFAEAHHIVPLGRLKGTTRSTLDDLITVCADCHRMLHRMSGEKDDIQELRCIVRRRKANRCR
jgi:5-methylcytosine-specific restriction endonuclease McrA